MESLCLKIDSKSRYTIEREINNYYRLGCINTTSMPANFVGDEDDDYYINASNKSGDFYVKLTKQLDGTYMLFASPMDLKNNR